MDLSMAGGLLRLARAALRWFSLRDPTLAGWRFRNPCAAPRRPFLSCGSVLTPNKRMKLSRGGQGRPSTLIAAQQAVYPWHAGVRHGPHVGQVLAPYGRKGRSPD